MTPKSAHFFQPACENSLSASRSRTLSFNSSRANSMAAVWSSRCSGVRSNSMVRFSVGYNFVDQFRDSLAHIGDQAVVGDFKDRRLRIVVNGDDDFGVLHAGQML